MDNQADELAASKIRSECMTGDRERDHEAADTVIVDLLSQLGYTKTVAAWEAVEKYWA